MNSRIQTTLSLIFTPSPPYPYPYIPTPIYINHPNKSLYPLFTLNTFPLTYEDTSPVYPNLLTSVASASHFQRLPTNHIPSSPTLWESSDGVELGEWAFDSFIICLETDWYFCKKREDLFCCKVWINQQFSISSSTDCLALTSYPSFFLPSSHSHSLSLSSLHPFRLFISVNCIHHLPHFSLHASSLSSLHTSSPLIFPPSYHATTLILN